MTTTTWILSDVHLRWDRPERAERLARFVERRDPSRDRLVIGGDLCDFWFASRQSHTEPPDQPPRCLGLRSLAGFVASGGRLSLIAGNHDQWLNHYYQRVLNTSFTPEPWVETIGGRVVHLYHGHRIGRPPFWKVAMESQRFLDAFRVLPEPFAVGLSQRLDRNNDRTRLEDDRRVLARYQAYVQTHARQAHLILFGHIHTPVFHPARDDVFPPRPSWAVLGGWQTQSSWLRLDDDPDHPPCLVVE
jgi:UDP-2,3-diacylglucosamine hydrolase